MSVLVTMSTCTVSCNQHNLFESNASIGKENLLKIGTSSIITLISELIGPIRGKKSDPLCMGNPLSMDEITGKSEKTAHSQEIPHSAVETLSVFIDAAPEDMALVPQIEKLLKANEIEYKPPLDFSNPPSTIRKELEGKLSSCNTVILLYDKASPQWLQQQLTYFRRSLAWRDQPLETIVFTPTDKPDLRKSLPNTRILNKLNADTLLNIFS
jgi:hypothetical protein